MSRLLAGKVAIVTGSGQGVGKDTAICMAQLGAKVVTNNRKPGSSLNSFERGNLDFTEEERHRLQSVSGDAQTCADEIIQMGGQAVPFFGDVSDFKTAGEIVQTAIDHFGRVDIIVNNAASTWVGSIADMDEYSWEVNVVSKLKGSFNMIHHALPYMKEQKYGRILNTSSEAFLGLKGMAGYSAASAGLVAMTKAAAQDLFEYGITVNSYTPLAKTRSWYNMLATYRLQGVPSEAVDAGAPEAMRNTADRMVPFLAYLASDQAGNITGYNFKLAADGLIGVWSNSEIVSQIMKNEGPWTIEDLEQQVPELLQHVDAQRTTIDLK